MQWIYALPLLLIPYSVFSNDNFDRLYQIRELRRLSFGSCNNQSDYQPLWEDLLRQKPDLWIWGGDNVYVDWMAGQNIQNAYEFQNKQPLYSKFKKYTPIIGTWDDHDYGYDNATGSFPGKKESQQLALDFLEVPKRSHLRKQEGLYTSYEFGEDSRRVKIILLDNRYFKNLDYEYPMLGKTQWDWLKQLLTKSRAKIHFIVTGLPVTSPLIPYTEEWAETNELTRMINLLKETKTKGVVFLTGDKHFHSIYQRWGHLEFMSSGMTHVAPRKTWWYLARKYPTTYFGLAYGQIDIDWEEEIPLLTMSMRTPYGQDIHLTKFKWQDEGWTRAKDQGPIFPYPDNF